MNTTISNYLLILVISVLFGTAKQALACNYDRISRLPVYENIQEPKKILSIPQAHGLCVAASGDFAVVPFNKKGKFYLYHNCGKLMRVVQLPKGFGHSTDCEFVQHKLYITDEYGKGLYKYSANGNFLQVVARGEPFLYMASCKGHLYVTLFRSHKRNVVVYYNDKEIRQFDVPGRPRDIVVSTDSNLYISNWSNKIQVFSLKGKRIKEITYANLGTADGIAMDISGKLIISDRSKPPKLLVYSPCGKLIKHIRTGFGAPSDVEIGNDGSVMMADVVTSKVYFY